MPSHALEEYEKFLISRRTCTREKKLIFLFLLTVSFTSAYYRNEDFDLGERMYRFKIMNDMISQHCR